MMDQLGRQPEVGHGGNPDSLGVDLEYLKFAEFRKANPPSFVGAFDPDKEDEWVKAMEKVFSILDCMDRQKVTFATYMLEADTKFWQNGVGRLLQESQVVITWNMFKDAFYHKYFPTSVQNAKELEFMQLCQGIVVYQSILLNSKSYASLLQFISRTLMKHENVLSLKADYEKIFSQP